MIKKMADENVKFRLAVSLHSARQSLREKLCLLLKISLGRIIRFIETLVLKTEKSNF